MPGWWRSRRMIGWPGNSRSGERGAVCSSQSMNADALGLDWAETSPAHATPTPPRSPLPGFSVVGNIPYNITSPLLEKALTPPLPTRIVFLVQKEVADRIAAPPGSRTYGALSVGIQATCKVERLFTGEGGRLSASTQGGQRRGAAHALGAAPGAGGAGDRRFAASWWPLSASVASSCETRSRRPCASRRTWRLPGWCRWASIRRRAPRRWHRRISPAS